MGTRYISRLCQTHSRLLRLTEFNCLQLPGHWKRYCFVNRNFCIVSTFSKRCYTTDKSPPKQPNSGKEDAFMFKGGKPQHRREFDEALQGLARAQKAQRAETRQPLVKLGILVAAGLGFLGFSLFLNKKLREQQMDLLTSGKQTADPVYIGGDWTLVDHFGKTVTNEDFKGQWCILYFGFTHCPDICPDEIEKIIEVTEILERDKSMPKMTPLFITVDPDRDKPPVMKEYLEEFSPKLIGLTGSWEQLNVILKEFKVYFSIGPKDEDGDYIVDHSIITFLMNPDGKYTAHFPRSKSNIEIADGIKRHVGSYKLQYR